MIYYNKSAPNLNKDNTILNEMHPKTKIIILKGEDKISRKYFSFPILNACLVIIILLELPTMLYSFYFNDIYENFSFDSMEQQLKKQFSSAII